MMKPKVKSAVSNRHAARIEDALGAVSLFVLLFAGLGFSGPF
jgi:hypothetical protein